MADLWIYALLPLAGFVAGVVNTIAGGGSFLVLPCLMLLGMPEQVANGTNRVAIALQSLYSVRAYHEQRPIDRSAVIRLLGPSIPGLAIGFVLATVLSPRAFRSVVGVLFLAFVVFMLIENRAGSLNRQGAPCMISATWASASRVRAPTETRTGERGARAAHVARSDGRWLRR